MEFEASLNRIVESPNLKVGATHNLYRLYITKMKGDAGFSSHHWSG